MKILCSYKKIFIVLIVYYFIIFSLIACTGIRLVSKNGSIVYARTLEWRENLYPHVIIVPRNQKHCGSSSTNTGIVWHNKYAFTGITIGNRSFLIDGVNECGLAAGLFSFWDDIEYSVLDEDVQHHIAPWEVVNYILSYCATVHDIYHCLNNIKIVPVYLDEVDEVPPLHYIVHDIEGNCVVIEHINHTIRVYENFLGVITNSPDFSWHLTNLSTYINPSIAGYKVVTAIDTKHINFDLLTLPSDFSSPSRFIKAVVYSQCAPLIANVFELVLQAFHILNQFDIPRGAVRSTERDFFTYTHWTSAINLSEKKYYFRTYENQRIRMVNLMEYDLDSENIAWYCLNEFEDVENITHKFVGGCINDE